VSIVFCFLRRKGCRGAPCGGCPCWRSRDTSGWGMRRRSPETPSEEARRSSCGLMAWRKPCMNRELSARSCCNSNASFLCFVVSFFRRPLEYFSIIHSAMCYLLFAICAFICRTQEDGYHWSNRGRSLMLFLIFSSFNAWSVSLFSFQLCICCSRFTICSFCFAETPEYGQRCSNLLYLLCFL
jgi:hypothetical protein